MTPMPTCQRPRVPYLLILSEGAENEKAPLTELSRLSLACFLFNLLLYACALILILYFNF
jgi:hypothetical protein